MKRDDAMRSLRMAGQVQRYHTWPTLRTQTVADHTWNVMRIYQRLFGNMTPEVSTYLLYHDAPGELWSGDAPYPAKLRSSLLRQGSQQLEEMAREACDVGTIRIDPHERARCKACDLLEMWEFGAQEVLMGNTLAMPIYQELGVAALDLPNLTAGDIQTIKNYLATHEGELP